MLRKHCPQRSDHSCWHKFLLQTLLQLYRKNLQAAHRIFAKATAVGPKLPGPQSKPPQKLPPPAGPITSGPGWFSQLQVPGPLLWSTASKQVHNPASWPPGSQGHTCTSGGGPWPSTQVSKGPFLLVSERLDKKNGNLSGIGKCLKDFKYQHKIININRALTGARQYTSLVSPAEYKPLKDRTRVWAVYD